MATENASDRWARLTTEADRLLAAGDPVSARAVLGSVAYEQRYTRPDGSRITHDPDSTGGDSTPWFKFISGLSSGR
jgi:hypothetical protein